MDPFLAGFDKVMEFVDTLQATGVKLRHIDVGGGLGIRYRDEQPPAIAAYVGAMFKRLGQRPVQLLFEPGRALVGNAGVLLTRVEYLKRGARDFAIVDAAMNDLMRPALYEAWHDVEPVRPRKGSARRYDLVGPVCESGDWLARERELVLEPADLLAIRSAGAYGMSMSSNYNTRPRAAEVMVDGEGVHLVRPRETVRSLFAGESPLPG
jgi:diaminopimelate decarboxylase